MKNFIGAFFTICTLFGSVSAIRTSSLQLQTELAETRLSTDVSAEQTNCATLIACPDT